jgi:hypothetical protein
MKTAKTAVALRVLTAINNRETPEERDLALLRAYCPDDRGSRVPSPTINVYRFHQASVR